MSDNRYNVLKKNVFLFKTFFDRVTIDSPLVPTIKLLMQRISWIISSSFRNQTYASNKASLLGNVDSSTSRKKFDGYQYFALLDAVE